MKLTLKPGTGAKRKCMGAVFVEGEVVEMDLTPAQVANLPAQIIVVPEKKKKAKGGK